jgi:hypothetical protein
MVKEKRGRPDLEYLSRERIILAGLEALGVTPVTMRGVTYGIDTLAGLIDKDPPMIEISLSEDSVTVRPTQAGDQVVKQLPPR